MKAGFAVRIVFLKAILSSIASGFPLENPCLETCNSDADITAEILQTCIEKCMISGDCCGNRLNGEAPHSSNARLSCANGCEIAYYRATVKECKADCAVGNDPEICEYNHPNIKTPFSMCWNCQEGCDGWPDSKACEDGCDFAKELPEFYKYVEKPGGSCDYDDIPRFLFAGQSNMEGWSGEALEGSFQKIVQIINRKKPKKKIRKLLQNHLNNAEEAEDLTSKNEARYLYAMRRFLKKKKVFNDHPTSICSFTQPAVPSLDCERPVSSTACGGGYYGYGPEFMFGHVFPTQKSPLKGKKIGIVKVAEGGTKIWHNWMKENKDGGPEDRNHWNALVDAIKGANGSLEAFVWFQGESDAFDELGKANYLDFLTEFVADVRKEIFDTSTKFSSPEDIPVIIVELGHWIYDIDAPNPIIAAQNIFVQNDPNAAIVNTGSGEGKVQMTAFYHFDAASQLIIGRRVAIEMAKILRQNNNK